MKIPMKIAVISDIHANMEALSVVLEDIKNRGIEDIYCLGDVVGYGPNPEETLEISRGFKLMLLGNHDGAAYNKDGLESFNWIAAMAVNWTRRRIQPAPEDDPDDIKAANWNFLASLKPTKKEGRVLFAHGAVSGNKDYIFQPKDAEPTFKRMAENGITTCFVGHTHIPCVITEDGDYITQEDDAIYPRVGDGKRLVINVGSVGQPRDKDWRACYLIVNGPDIIYRRLEYDVDRTIEKIYEEDELNNFLGDRLKPR